MKPFIHQTFWSDSDVEALDCRQKLALLWIFTNPQMNACGFFETSKRRFSFETGLEEDVLAEVLEALPRALKGFKDGGLIYSRNFIRHQFGAGEQLVKNNVFKSVLSAFRGAKLPELREAILEDYPEIAEHGQAYAERPHPDHITAAGLRAAILERDDYTCLITNEKLPEEELAVDHLVPRVAGGETVPENLFAVSKRINSRKKDLPLEDFCKKACLDFQAISERAKERASKPLADSPKGKGLGTVRKSTGTDRKEGSGKDAAPEVFRLQVCGLYNRRADTVWGEKEKRAFASITVFPTPAEWETMVRYYAKERAKGDGVHRRDLLTFLNNFSGEMDRARNSVKQRAPLAPSRAVEALPDPEWWREYQTAHPEHDSQHFAQLSAQERDAASEWAFARQREAFTAAKAGMTGEGE